ncbi:transposase [Rhodococcus ruber]|uniref:transposase n=1 Tax=Rhodococcus ruber TaxID=1830 RepID=UPI0011AB30CD|nr:transposase [Rhodococcus ruber]
MDATILAAVTPGLTNGRHEGLNTKVRVLIRRTYGFHTAQNALTLILLTCGAEDRENLSLVDVADPRVCSPNG